MAQVAALVAEKLNEMWVLSAHDRSTEALTVTKLVGSSPILQLWQLQVGWHPYLRYRPLTPFTLRSAHCLRLFNHDIGGNTVYLARKTFWRFLAVSDKPVWFNASESIGRYKFLRSTK